MYIVTSYSVVVSFGTLILSYAEAFVNKITAARFSRRVMIQLMGDK